MRKNVAGQSVSAEMTSSADGSEFTGAVVCYVTLDNGSQAVGSVASGACAHKGHGLHTYMPSQAETNGDENKYTFVGTGAVTVTVPYSIGFPQTGDNFARLGAPVGASLSADIAAAKADLVTLLARITSTLFSGITSLAHWLGMMAGKQAVNSTAQTEIRATGAGSGTYDGTTDSLEALRDAGSSGLDAAGVRTALGMASANMDTQLAFPKAFMVNWELTNVTATTANLRVWPVGTAHVNGTGELAIIPLVRADTTPASPWTKATL